VRMICWCRRTVVSMHGRSTLGLWLY
jgi:hypothetical protein